MKLLTSIPARRDGCVNVTLPATRQDIKFLPDASGALVADVTDEADVAALLRLETFEPADERDFDAAEALLGKAVAADESEDDDGTDDDDSDEFDEVLNGGAPIEANTPPKTKDAPPAAAASGHTSARRRAAR